MNNLGKGMFIWILDECAAGDPVTLAKKAVAAGISWIQIKIQHSYDNVVYEYNKETLAPAVDALREQNISVWGWGWVIGATFSRKSIAKEEAMVAANVMLKYDLDGFIVNAEAQMKRPGANVWAIDYMLALRNSLPGLPIGLSSYRYPTLHRSLPWEVYAKYCDFWCPQVYWMWAHNPVYQLRRSIRELNDKGMLPIIPTGAAYKERGWPGPNVREIDQFNAEVQEQKLPGISWWSWQHAERRRDWWEAIAEHKWDTPNPPPVEKHKVEVHHPSEVEVTTKQVS